ncbi:putative TonB-dependent receptor [Gluconacetobacter diazotrophicus PA1 5]|uniref:Putative TonB-dependent receptor n=2 Tax=Gluconacetobacter diazotrophicus TaxID=33996 RepID=A9HDI3_GLUDA|nr:putative TonB-dependent receptor [Gluconacetobacter diazotrophicus PA1 5]
MVSSVAPTAGAQSKSPSHPGKAPSDNNDAPSMMGATAPTDARGEVVEVHGSRHTAVGGGMMTHEDAAKSRSTVTAEFIAKQTPGLNPMQLIQYLPGVNTTSVDPLGINGGEMTMRGLNQSQIGFTLEGFPINDIGNYAVYPQEIVDSENLRMINVEQGSADLDSPHISATGGAVDMYLIDPTDHFGGTVDGTYGNYNSRRIFGRVNTGFIGNTNLKGFVSFSAADEHSWRGPGDQSKLHGETKWVNAWGNGNVISFSLIGNQSESTLFPSMSLANWKKYGAYYTYDAKWNPKAPDANYYQLHRNPFTNIYASAPSTFTLTDNLTLTETPYFWYGNGNGGGAYNESLTSQQWGAQSLTGSIGPYNASNTKSMLLYNPSNTQTYRPGAVTKLSLHTGINRLTVGYWFEYSKQLQTGPYSLVNMATGQPYDEYGGGPNMVLSNGMTAEYRDTLTQTRIHTMFIDDSLSLLHGRLTIEGGLKYAVVDRDGHNFLPDTSTGPYIHGSWQEPLPAVSIRYKINDENQLFASSTTNFRIPMNTSLYDSGTYKQGVGYTAKANADTKPEISISEEFGWRYQGPLLNSTLSYFHYNFTNRLYTQTLIDPSGAIYTRSINGGGSHADGVDFEVGTRPILYHLRPYFSAEYVNARTDSNVGAGNGDYVFSKGKFAPQTPKYQLAFHLDYDDGHLFGGFGLKYVARQYSTFNNDQSIPDYLTMDVNAGYRFKDVGPLKAPTLRLNLQNITNNHYLGFVHGTSANALPTTGVYGTKIAGASTSFDVAAPFFVGGTASVDF